MNAFIHLNPYRVRVKVDPQTCHSFAKITQPEIIFPSGSISAIIGDAVHNLRAALDYVAGEIMLGSGEDPESVYFPMDETRQSLISQPRYRKMERLAPDIAYLIANKIRPYKAANYGFWGLNRLDRADKHRAPTIIPVVGTVTVHCIEDQNQTMQFPKGTILILPGGRLPEVGSSADLQNQRNSYAPVDICFGKGEPFEGQSVIPTLHQLLELVASVIQTLEAHLKRGDPGQGATGISN